MAAPLRVLAGACLALLASAAALLLPAPAAAATEDEARATFVILLGKYVTWPESAFASPASPIVVAVVGNPGLASEMRRLSSGQRLDGRNVEIRETADAAGASGAHIAFVSDAAQSSALSASSVVRVLEAPGRLSDADIAIWVQSGRIAFAVNRRDVSRRGLKLSSKLMRLASSFD
jgi:hypothetical protein